MDKSIPAGAALLLQFIYKTETKKSAPECYGVIFGNRQTRLAVKLTEMTLAEVQTQQKVWNTSAWSRLFKSTKKSSAAGAAQFMVFTLRELIQELRLSGSQLFDGNLQDRLAYHLLKRRGYEAFMSGAITRTQFGKHLAQEWASFPVLANTKGAHRALKRGQSYYAGDGLNSSLTSPETVEKILNEVKAMGSSVRPPVDYEIPVPTPKPAPQPRISWFAALVAAVSTTLFAGWTWFVSLPCNLVGLFCGG